MPDVYKILIQQEITTRDGYLLSVEKAIDLPFPPFVGLMLGNFAPDPDDEPGDDCGEPVRSVGFDVKNGVALIPINTFSFLCEDEEGDDPSYGTKNHLFGTPGFFYHGWKITRESRLDGH